MDEEALGAEGLNANFSLSELSRGEADELGRLSLDWLENLLAEEGAAESKRAFLLSVGPESKNLRKAGFACDPDLASGASAALRFPWYSMGGMLAECNA